MRWADYVERLMAGRNQEEVAILSGVSQSSISRWVKKGQHPNAESAVDFARACGGNPVQALVILGIIRPNEVDQVVEVGATADDLTNGELVAQLARRLGVQIATQAERRSG